MSQVELISWLLPSLPEMDEILRKVRDKHLIPEVLPENEQLAETLSQEQTLGEWEAVRQKIENGLRAWFQSESSGLEKITKLYNDAIENSDEIKALLTGETVKVPEDVADYLIEGLNINAVSGLEALNLFFRKGSEKLIDMIDMS